ncbi:MAG: rhomboid family intramembrane serine protease [Pseudomonadota bacterium]
MFIIPIGDRVNWKKPPLITVLLIMANCFVFFFLQGNDKQNEAKAARYYFSSELPNWELKRYASHLAAQADVAQVRRFNARLGQAAGQLWALQQMEHDARFMRALRAGQIIRPQDQEFAAWSAQRKRYEAKQSFTQRYVYRVDTPSWLTALSATFMHSGFEHLFGNMLLLFLVGFLVEAVIGKALFALAYLVSAYAAILTFSLTIKGVGVGYLGASGAISGIMGLYTVIFGFRKIDFFYSLGFYFDYVRAPAIALLPVWLGNELYQFWRNDAVQIAYMAHFGGLLGGALMGVLYRYYRPLQINQHHAAVLRKSMDAEAFQRGLDHLGAMAFAQALAVFKSLQEQHPDDINLARLVYRAAKANPASEDYHSAALKLLAWTATDAESVRQTHAIFQEYLLCAKPAMRLGKNLVAQLAKRFAGAAYLEDADKLAQLLQRSAPQHKALPGVLLALARGHYRAQNPARFDSILQDLRRQFPNSPEAELAVSMLRLAASQT